MSSLILTCNAGSNNTKLAAFNAETLQSVDHAAVHSLDEVIAWLKTHENVVRLPHYTNPPP